MHRKGIALIPILALVVALPLLVLAVINGGFDIRKRAAPEPTIPTSITGPACNLTVNPPRTCPPEYNCLYMSQTAGGEGQCVMGTQPTPTSTSTPTFSCNSTVNPPRPCPTGYKCVYPPETSQQPLPAGRNGQCIANATATAIPTSTPNCNICTGSAGTVYTCPIKDIASGITYNGKCALNNIQSCGGQTYCCSSGGYWTTDKTQCTFIETPKPSSTPAPTTPSPTPSPWCVNQCGDGKCADVVCLAIGCPCAETPQNCPQDCKSTPTPTPTPNICNITLSGSPSNDQISKCTAMKGRIYCGNGWCSCICPSITPKPTATPTVRPTIKPTPIPTTKPNTPPQIITTILPIARVGRSYSAYIEGRDIDLTNTFTMTIGNLPTGFLKGPCSRTTQFGSTAMTVCVIYGKPARIGIFLINVVLTDNRGGKSAKNILLFVF